MEDQLQRLRAAREARVNQAQSQQRHADLVLSNSQLEKTVVESFRLLVKYLSTRTDKVAVVNQLREVGTPDALKVAQAVDNMHTTLKTLENVDMGPLEKIMDNVLTEIGKLPKEFPQLEIPKPIDNTNEFRALGQKIDALIEAVNSQVTTVTSPDVNVAPPIVDVRTDVQPLATEVSKTSKEINALRKDQPIKDGAMQTRDITSMVNEKYTRFKVIYREDDFDEDEEERLVDSIRYYNGNQLVKTLQFSYSGRDLSGVRAI